MAAAIVPEIAADAPIIGNCFARMRREMHRGARSRRHRERSQKAKRTEAARDRAAEGQKPDRIDAKMRPVCMHESVGDEGPYLGAAARQDSAEHGRRIVAHRNEGEGEQKIDVLLLGEQQLRTI